MIFLLFLVGTVCSALFLASTFGFGTFVGCSHLFFDFIISLFRVIGQILYIITGFLFELSNQLAYACVKCLPFAWKVVTIVTSFLLWVGSQVIRGIFGTGNVFLTSISWIFCLCIFCLCTERFFKRIPSDEIEDNNRNLIQEVNQRMEYENQENENEENSLEEADINMAAEDNDRNAVRELEHRQINRQSLQREPPTMFHGERLIVQLPDRRKTRQRLGHLNFRSENTDTESSGSCYSSDTEEHETEGSSSFINSAGVRRRRHSRTEDNLCVVCLDRQRNTAVFPCGHLHLCTQCVELIMNKKKNCPTCQSDIQEYRRVYI